MAITEVDSARAEAFAGRTVQILNDAMLSLLLSVGHQTRLLDVMAEQAGVTSEELAQAAGLDERYVREWLVRLTNARFELRDALSVEPGAYDLVTAFDVIHDLPRPAETSRPRVTSTRTSSIRSGRRSTPRRSSTA